MGILEQQWLLPSCGFLFSLSMIQRSLRNTEYCSLHTLLSNFQGHFESSQVEGQLPTICGDTLLQLYSSGHGVVAHSPCCSRQYGWLEGNEGTAMFDWYMDTVFNIFLYTLITGFEPQRVCNWSDSEEQSHRMMIQFVCVCMLCVCVCMCAVLCVCVCCVCVCVCCVCVCVCCVCGCVGRGEGGMPPYSFTLISHLKSQKVL